MVGFRPILLWLVALAFSFCSICHAGPIGRLCQWADEALGRIFIKNNLGAWLARPEVQTPLRDYQRQRIRHLAAEAARKAELLKPGSSIPVQDSQFEIVGYLGGGKDTDVYLVRTPLGQMAVKHFKRGPRAMQSHLVGLERLARSRNLNTPEIFLEDPATSNVLMSAVDGVDIEDIKSAPLPAWIKDPILAEYDSLISRTGLDLASFNVRLSFDGLLHVLDRN